MKMKNRSNGSPMKKRKRKRFNWITLFLNNFFVSFSASIPPWTSPSPVAASIPLGIDGFYSSRDIYSSDSGFYSSRDLAHSSLVPIPTPSLASSATGMSLRHSPSSSARPPTPAPSSASASVPSSQGVVDSRILILPTIDRYMFLIKCTCILTFAQLQQAIKLCKVDY
ncbi:hypothetical protein M9H77_21727 [Catharanthus roseus]|uniref:Uncharacterized protein n=1 Tax=Catharanthus roseus TaxID=4058 RepID=A0ACC0AP96_CATRO|nr:hypothetical protein M9H77_21727 [Catharanthus roseus]